MIPRPRGAKGDPEQKKDQRHSHDKVPAASGTGKNRGVLIAAGAFVAVVIGILAYHQATKPRLVRKPTQVCSGKIYLQKKPMDGAVVTLWPVDDDGKAPRPHATSNANGEFKLRTYEPDEGPADGAPVGEYIVTIQWPDPIPQPKDAPIAPNGKPYWMDPDDAPKDKLQDRYSSKAVSRLKLTVKSGVTELEPIQLH